ncbi:hypothetical protein [Ehrlichia canis]|uniref:hypothetical protein n=1 Tax=Ehrlichia canis TaxID=944 RepID=UPI000C840CBE|nr:hypothetical protein [Ehrlichia canis]AUO55010.1 hypothetical protein C1I72_04045 [Ehrlichia canis]UKC52972.1 hypothetical protein s20019040002_000013 [Ehrlichia canis]UKC53909.1 hypothetical protein s20026770001_000013 [Ehrlichia canis]UKC54845.1 hypothetical protein s21009500007_000013 [Ehrlichia canis]
MLARFDTSNKKLSSVPESSTQDSENGNVSLRNDSVNQRTADQYFSVFNLQHDVLENLNNVLLSYYEETFSFISLVEKNESFFLKTICSSCITNFFYDLRFFIYNLNTLVNNPTLKLDIPDVVISKDTLCQSCATFVLHYENILLHRTSTTMPSWQTVVCDDSHTTIQTNAVGEQHNRSINDNMLFISEQMDFVLSITGQIHAILLRLQQGKASYKELLEKSTDLVVLYNKCNVELKINTLTMFLKHILSELIECRSIFNVMLLCNKDKQAELLDRELQICRNDSNLRLVRILILNRVLSRENCRTRLFGDRNIAHSTQRVFNPKEQINSDSVDMHLMSDVKHVKSEVSNSDVFACNSGNGGNFKKTTDQLIQGQSDDVHHYYELECGSEIYTAMSNVGKEWDQNVHSNSKCDDDPAMHDYYSIDHEASGLDGTTPTFVSVPKDMLSDTQSSSATKGDRILDYKLSYEESDKASEACAVISSVNETRDQGMHSGSEYNNGSAMHDYYNIRYKASELDGTIPIFVSGPEDMLSDTQSSSATKRDRVLDYNLSYEESGKSSEACAVMASVDKTCDQSICRSGEYENNPAVCGYSIDHEASGLDGTTPAFVSGPKDMLGDTRSNSTTKRDGIPDRSDVNHSIVEYMKSEEGRRYLLDTLIREAGDMNQLVKILAAELGKEALVDILPNMSLAYIECVLSNDNTSVTHRRVDGNFVRPCGGGAFLKMQLLQDFISCVNVESNNKIEESASSKELFDKKSDRCVSVVSKDKLKIGSAVSRSYSDAKLVKKERYVRRKLSCRNNNAEGNVNLSNTLSSQIKEFVSFGTLDCMDVSDPSSSKQDLSSQASSCQSNKRDVSAENLPVVSGCMVDPVALVDQYAVHTNKVLENFIKDMIDGLNKSIDQYLRFTDKLQKESNLLNWVLYFLINKNSFSACKSAILEDLKPCFLYYNLITSIPDLDLHVKKLDASWVDSYVKSLHTLVHKSQINGVSFGVSKDYVIRRLSKYQMQVYDVKRLSQSFEVFNSISFSKQNLDSFVIKNKVIISLKYFKTNEICSELDGARYGGMIIKGDIPKKLILICNNLTLYGNVKGKVISSYGELIKIVGSVTGGLLINEESASDSSTVSVDNYVQDRSAIEVEDSIEYRNVPCMVEICGNVAGTVIVKNSDIIVNGKVSNKGSVISKFGKCACFVNTIAGSIMLKRTKYAIFNDVVYSTTHLIVEECDVYLRKEKKLQLDLGFIDSKFIPLSEGFKLDVSRLKKMIDEKNKRNSNDDGATVSTKPQRSKGNIVRSKNIHSFFSNVRVNSMSELMAI